MADPEHLATLAQGVGAWNQWRKERPEILPDLTGAHLEGKDLRSADFTLAALTHMAVTNGDLRRVNLSWSHCRQANLSGSNLRDATLRFTDLDGANLKGATLGRANLRGARLRDANLTAAYLHSAVLEEADLSGASLGGADATGCYLLAANLSGAQLADADLTNAAIGGTVFVDIDLSSVKGLTTVRLMGPCSVGIDTIYRSKGNIPEVFLRGAGVPEDFIVYARSLAAHPIEFYSCFISYSSTDDDFARRLHADLQQANVRCWFAPEDLKIGDKFRTRIDESIRLYDKLMVILTEDSIASSWVEEEVEAALEKERKQSGKLVLFPIRLDDAVMETDLAWAASLRRTRHIGDFRNWKNHDAFKKAFERLLRDLKSSG